MKAIRIFSVAAFFAACLVGAPKVSAVAVDLELQLLVDVSGSIDAGEFLLQRDGYAAAFQNVAIQNAIANGAIGSIAVQLIYWSSGTLQQVAVDWTPVSDAASANALAAAILATARPFNNNTGPQSAMDFGAPLFNNNGFEGTRLVMDVSGDGTRNSDLSGTVGRDAALLVVDSINGLVIGGSQSVFDYYNDFVIGGTNPFIVTASNFSDFGAAVDSKILREVRGVPEPGTLLLLGVSLVGLAFARRRLVA